VTSGAWSTARAARRGREARLGLGRGGDAVGELVDVERGHGRQRMTFTYDPAMTAHDSDSTRWEAGIARYREVSGDDFIAFERGTVPFFDLMIEQLFGEIWTRPELSIPERRLLLIGAIAAQGHFDILQIQLTRALAVGELTPAQVREAVIQLTPYIGYPSSGGLLQASEAHHSDHQRKDPDGE
jgi:alkylhydroperoxidase/carboxymuconolactone decarboxylase family protein YurZ